MARKTSDIIRQLRELRGFSQRKLAALAECSDGTIRRIESDEGSPSVDLVRRLLDVLDADDQTRLALMGSQPAAA